MFLRHLGFVIRSRLQQQARISLRVDVKDAANIRVGRGVKVHASALLDASRNGGIALGDGCTINRFALIQGGRGGVRLGPGVEVNNFSIVNGTGGVDIGANTLIGPGVKIISYHHRHAAGQPIRMQQTEGRAIHVGEDVWIGANAVILSGVTIGDGSVIGAGAVVTRDIPPGVIVAGVPARVIRSRD